MISYDPHDTLSIAIDHHSKECLCRLPQRRRWGASVELRAVRAKIQPDSPMFWLFVVSTVYLVVQVLLFDERRYLEWDEAQYLARSSAHLANPGWRAHRALGAAWIISPVTWIGGSLVAIRWYLVAMSSLVVGLAFSRWIHAVGVVAPVSMAIFVSGWLTLFYGSEISPNLYLAASAVGATGALATYIVRRQRTDLIFLAGFVGTAFLLRPSDAAVLLIGLGLVSVVVVEPTHVLRVWRALLLGTLVGVVPWLIESYSYFGGPFARVGVASGIVGGGFTSNVFEHLLLADGPIFGPDLSRVVSPAVVAVFVIGGFIAAYGVLSRDQTSSVGAAFVVGMLMALPYLVFVDALAPRFLLPAIALLSIPIGRGVLSLLDRHAPLGVLAVGFLLLTSIWSVSVAISVHRYEFGYRDVIRQAGTAMAKQTDAGACHFLSAFGAPSIVVETGCEGQHLYVGQLRCQVESMQSHAPGSDILVVLRDRTVVDEFRFLTPVSDSGFPEPLVLFTVQAGSDTGCRSG